MQMEWAKLKEEYITNQTLTLAALAEKHGVPVQEVKKHSAGHGWGKEKKAHYRVPHAGAQVQKSDTENSENSLLSQTQKINRIAEKLLNNIEEGTALFEKPTHIATLTGALKEVTAILRDVNEIPNCKDRHKYELDKRKLELESAKKAEQMEETGGVVVLPEVKTHE